MDDTIREVRPKATLVNVSKIKNDQKSSSKGEIVNISKMMSREAERHNKMQTREANCLVQKVLLFRLATTTVPVAKRIPTAAGGGKPRTSPVPISAGYWMSWTHR